MSVVDRREACKTLFMAALQTVHKILISLGIGEIFVLGVYLRSFCRERLGSYIVMLEVCVGSRLIRG